MEGICGKAPPFRCKQYTISFNENLITQKETKAVTETTGINTTSFFISLIANCSSMVTWFYVEINQMVEWHYLVAITTDRVIFLACLEWNKIPASNVILKSHLLLRSNLGRRQQCWHWQNSFIHKAKLKGRLKAT